MKTVNMSIRIKCLIEMALENQISWLTLDSIINELTPTLENSKQIIKLLLKEFRGHQSVCLIKISNGSRDISEDVIEIDENQSITKRVITIQEKDSEDGFQVLGERKSTEGLTNKKSENSL